MSSEPALRDLPCINAGSDWRWRLLFRCYNAEQIQISQRQTHWYSVCRE